ALAHALWLLVLLKLITPPLYPLTFQTPHQLADETVVVSIPGTQAEPSPVAVDEKDAPPPMDLANTEEIPAEPYADMPASEPTKTAPSGPTSGSLPWKEAVGFVWMMGTAIWFALAIIRLVRFRRLLRHG